MQRPSFAHANDENTIFVIVDADGRLDPNALRSSQPRCKIHKSAASNSACGSTTDSTHSPGCKMSNSASTAALPNRPDRVGDSLMGGNGKRTGCPHSTASSAQEHPGRGATPRPKIRTSACNCSRAGWRGTHGTRHCRPTRRLQTRGGALPASGPRYRKWNLQAMSHLRTIKMLLLDDREAFDLFWPLQPTAAGVVGSVNDRCPVFSPSSRHAVHLREHSVGMVVAGIPVLRIWGTSDRCVGMASGRGHDSWATCAD